MASLKVTEKGLEVCGKGLFIIYDVPVRVVGDRGLHPQGFQSMLKKFIDSGRVTRLQASVLLVEDRALLEPLINLILRYNGSALVVEGSYVHYLGR
jgi:hypothetical protein